MINIPPEISVIVPVYNGEKFLPQALDSILAQTFEDFELICVDDGSTDSSVDILNAYAEKDARIRIIRQQNQYAGVARNNGIKQAQGRWFLFLDADDFFSPELLEKMHGRAQQDDADICIADADFYHDQYRKFKTGKSFLEKRFLPEKRPFSKDDIEDTILNITTMPVWNKLFKAAFIRENNIAFTTSKFAEDIGFMLPALLLAKRITVVDERLVHYRVGTAESATSKIDGDILAGYEAMCRERDGMIQRHMYSEKIKKSFANKALGNSLFFFSKAPSLDSYVMVYNKLARDGGFSDLDIHPDMEFYNQKHQAKLRAMLEAKDVYEYLFHQYKAEMQAREKLSYDKADLKMKLKKEREKVKALKEKNKALREKNAALKEKIADMRNSYTFRIGKIIMLLPHQLKQLFQRAK